MMEQTTKKEEAERQNLSGRKISIHSIMTRVGTMQTAINFKRYGHLKNILQGSSWISQQVHK